WPHSVIREVDACCRPQELSREGQRNAPPLVKRNYTNGIAMIQPDFNSQGPHCPVDLRTFDNQSLDRGRAPWVEALWLIVSTLLVDSSVPGSRHRVFLLRMFGASIGRRVAFKPRVRIKFPWRLEIGDDTWIGESVWIDNLAKVEIGSHCCISQGAYICTGSH